jgi:hypothetical protein
MVIHFFPSILANLSHYPEKLRASFLALVTDRVNIDTKTVTEASRLIDCICQVTVAALVRCLQEPTKSF